MASKTYNPEKRTWKGKSYKKGGKPIQEVKDKAAASTEAHWEVPPPLTPEELKALTDPAEHQELLKALQKEGSLLWVQTKPGRNWQQTCVIGVGKFRSRLEGNLYVDFLPVGPLRPYALDVDGNKLPSEARITHKENVEIRDQQYIWANLEKAVIALNQVKSGKVLNRVLEVLGVEEFQDWLWDDT